MSSKRAPVYRFLSLLIFAVMVCSGCPDDEKKDNQTDKPKPLKFSQEKSPEEERDVRALCEAGKKLGTIKRVRNRLKYLLAAFIENGGSPDFTDHFKVMGGADRHRFVEELFKKYGIEESCSSGLDAFDRVVDPRRKNKAVNHPSDQK